MGSRGCPSISKRGESVKKDTILIVPNPHFFEGHISQPVPHDRRRRGRQGDGCRGRVRVGICSARQPPFKERE